MAALCLSWAPPVEAPQVPETSSLLRMSPRSRKRIYQCLLSAAAGGKKTRMGVNTAHRSVRVALMYMTVDWIHLLKPGIRNQERYQYRLQLVLLWTLRKVCCFRAALSNIRSSVLWKLPSTGSLPKVLGVAREALATCFSSASLTSSASSAIPPVETGTPCQTGGPQVGRCCFRQSAPEAQAMRTSFTLLALCSPARGNLANDAPKK